TTAARSSSDKKRLRGARAVPPGNIGEISPADFARSAAAAVQGGSQGQDLFRTERTRFAFPAVGLVSPATNDNPAAALSEGTILRQAMNLTRDLINRPPQEIKP